MSQPRIGFAVLRFFDERTGNIESLLNLIRGVGELGCEATLLIPHPTSMLDLFNGVSVHAYAERSRLEANIFAVERRLARVCAEMRERFDVIQLQLPSPAFARVAERVRAIAGRPVVASFESGYHGAPAVPWPRPGKTLLSLLLRRAINDRCHARWTRFAFECCVVASQYQRRELEAAGCSTPIHVIPNATVCARFDDLQSLALDSGLLPPDKRVIAYVGHFNFIKGVPFLLRAFELLAARRSDVHLLVVGSGRGNESQAVRAGVEALGPLASLVERDIDVAGLLQRLDALALPYVASYGHQTYPNLVLEGLAAGVPLVSTDIPPVNEIVREGETGYLARPGDPGALADALARALDAGKSRLSSRQRELCRSHFDYRVVAARHVELYKGLLS
jgi:glycosyltransferase involved in cell wall biosynthesis